MATNGFDAGRFGRLVILIGFVTAVIVATAARVLPGEVFSIFAVAMGSVGMVTIMIGFFIAGSAAYDAGTG